MDLYKDQVFINSNLEEIKEVVGNLRKISAYNMDKGNDEISQLSVLVEKISDIYTKVEVSPGIFMTEKLYEEMKNNGI